MILSYLGVIAADPCKIDYLVNTQQLEYIIFIKANLISNDLMLLSKNPCVYV
jgi:hypothetical protein